METRWLYTTSENFPALREASGYTCVIPMGCVEKHGLHLPLGADIIEASGVALAGSQLETVTVFPDFTFGDYPDNSPTRPLGSITVPMEMEMDLLEILCEQIARNGYKKILILNGHGGNISWLQAFSRRLANKKRDFVFATYMIGLPAPHTLTKYILEHGNPFRRVALRCPAVDMHRVLSSSIITPENREALAKGKDALVGFDRKVPVGTAFLEELRTFDLREKDLIDYAEDLLIIHGTADEIVPYEDVYSFSEDKLIELIPVEGADHRFRNPLMMDLAIKHILEFFAL